MTNPIARMTGIWIACTRRAFAALRCARSAASSVKPASMSAAVAVPLTSTLRRSPEDGVPFPGGRQWARSAQAGAPQLGAQRLDVVEQLHDERRAREAELEIAREAQRGARTAQGVAAEAPVVGAAAGGAQHAFLGERDELRPLGADRKSTRLNSSHLVI